jgi:WD repeat-containing protein 19
VVPEDRESKIFPEAGLNDVISCMALTPDFLVYGTDMGGIAYFFLEDWTTVTKFKHITGQGGSPAMEVPSTEYIFLLEMKQGWCVCPLSWSEHCNFTGDGKCNERGWACTPHPHQPGLILPS